MIIDKIKIQALEIDRKAGGLEVKRIVLGAKYLAAELSDGRCGLSFRFNSDVFEASGGWMCPADFSGMKAAELICWAGDSRSLLKSGIGISVINALAPWDEMDSREGKGGAEAAGIKAGDVVGMVGFFPPLVRMLGDRDDIELRIFERGFREPHPCLYPDWSEYRLLPECDIVIMTGTSGINSTLDQMLSWCTGARQVSVTGPSTMMYPSAYEGTGATILAGARYLPNKKDEMFDAVGTGRCGAEILQFLEKFAFRL
ncbi:MAG: hypothetical protein JEZ04_06015 [Spirochaetales bacterium]|nr:hypothetical protein [Spirochaetales bacterium]